MLWQLPNHVTVDRYLLIYAASNWHFGLLDGIRAAVQAIHTLVHTAKLSVTELRNLMKLLDIP